MYFSLVNKGYGFYSQPVIMFKHAFGLLMGDFRFDNKIFTCVATHLAHNSAVKKRYAPMERNNITALSEKYHFCQTFEASQQGP